MRILRLAIIFSIIAMLGACAQTGVKDEVLLADATSNSTVKTVLGFVGEYKIEEKNLEEDQFNARVSVIFRNAEREAIADVTLKYSKIDGKWVLKSNLLAIRNVKVFNEPDLVQSKMHVADHREYFGFLFCDTECPKDELSTFSATDVELVSTAHDLDIGKLNYTLKEVHEDDYLSENVVHEVEGNYSFFDGWAYTTKEWTAVMSWKLNGTYRIEWMKNGVDNPQETLYEPNEVIDNIRITGELAYTRKSDKTTDVQNSLTINFIRGDEAYTLQPVFVDRGTEGYDLVVKYGMLENEAFLIHYEFCGWPEKDAEMYVISVDNSYGEFTKTGQ